MGMLDEVIGAALGPKSGSGLSSPIAMALMALLASKMAPGAGAQQSPVGGLGGLLDRLCSPLMLNRSDTRPEDSARA